MPLIKHVTAKIAALMAFSGHFCIFPTVAPRLFFQLKVFRFISCAPYDHCAHLPPTIVPCQYKCRLRKFLPTPSNIQKCILSRLSVDKPRMQRAAFSFPMHTPNITKATSTRHFFLSHFAPLCRSPPLVAYHPKFSFKHRESWLESGKLKNGEAMFF